MPIQMRIDPKSQVNVMSKQQFRKLREKFNFISAQTVSMEVDNHKIVGLFSASLKFREYSRPIQILVEEGSYEDMKICLQLAEKLKLLQRKN